MHKEEVELEATIKITRKLIDESKENLEQLKEKYSEHDNNLKELDRRLEKLRDKMTKRSSELSALKDQCTHLEENIKKISENLKSKQSLKDKNNSNLADLEKQYQEVEENKEDFLKLQSQMCELELEDIQVAKHLNYSFLNIVNKIFKIFISYVFSTKIILI